MEMFNYKKVLAKIIVFNAIPVVFLIVGFFIGDNPLFMYLIGLGFTAFIVSLIWSINKLI